MRMNDAYTPGLAAWPITVITFPLLWSSAQDSDARGGISLQSLSLLAVNILSRRIGDFAVTYVSSSPVHESCVTHQPDVWEHTVSLKSTHHTSLIDTNVVANVPSAGYNALANSAVVSIGVSHTGFLQCQCRSAIRLPSEVEPADWIGHQSCAMSTRHVLLFLPLHTVRRVLDRPTDRLGGLSVGYSAGVVSGLDYAIELGVPCLCHGIIL